MHRLLSFIVATHAREIGIHKAVGASRGDLYWLVFRGAGVVIGLGLVCGVATALLAARFLQGLLYGIGAEDPLSLATSSAIVVGVGLVASFLPARRAREIDPMVALKEE